MNSSKLLKWAVIDLETSGLNKYTSDILVCCVFDYTNRITTYKFLNVPDHKRIKTELMLINYLSSIELLIGFNINYDWEFIVRLFNKHNKPLPEFYFIDVRILVHHFCNTLPSYDLKALAWWFLCDPHMPLFEIRKYLSDNYDTTELSYLSKVPLNLIIKYCKHDVMITYQLLCLFIDQMEKFSCQIDMNLIPAVSEAERKGVYIDYKYFSSLNESLTKERNELITELQKKLNTNKSPLGKALQNYLFMTDLAKFTEKGNIKTSKEVLRKYKNNPVLTKVNRIREIDKLLSTYVKNFLAVTTEKDNQFHPCIIQTATFARRFNSANYYGNRGEITKGNILNIPNDPIIRKGIIAPEGYELLKMDLASIEARIASHAIAVFLDDQTFAREYRKNPAFNLYLFIAEKCGKIKTDKKHPMYKAYKQGTLAVLYGASPYKFVYTLQTLHQSPLSKEELISIYDLIKIHAPQISELQRFMANLAEKQGYLIDDFGSTYYVPPDEPHIAVNYYCQGCASNVLKFWWDKCWRILSDNDYIFATIHDEIDFAIYNNSTKEVRINAYKNTIKEIDFLEVPIEVEISLLGKNWSEC